MDVVVGIDGGATKTRGVLAGLDGRILSVAEDIASNFHHVGIEAAGGAIARVVAELSSKAEVNDPPVSLACGLAGVGRPADHKLMIGELERRFPGSQIILVTDADTTLVGGCLDDAGIIVIAGTGSMIYGKNRKGETDRVGGYGALLSDEGSGYALAVAGLRAIVRSHDGLEPETLITPKILEQLGKSNVEELVTWSLLPANGKEEIARLAKSVLEAFTAGDPLAQRIVVDEADYLATGVSILHRRLGLEPATSVVLSGGTFQHCDAYAGLLTRKIRYFLPAAKVGTPKLPPVLGAAMYALHQVQVQVNPEIIGRLSDTYAQKNSNAGVKL